MLTRRAALKGGTAAVAGAAAITAAGTVAAVITKESEPLLELERQWQEQLAVKHRIPDWAPEEEYEAQCCVIDDIELAIMHTPARSFAGLAAKLRLVAHLQDGETICWGERTVLSALHDAERLAGEAQS